jgi:hypothetical protein
MHKPALRLLKRTPIIGRHRIARAVRIYGQTDRIPFPSYCRRVVLDDARNPHQMQRLRHPLARLSQHGLSQPAYILEQNDEK